MPKQNATPPIASTLATLAGCAIVVGSLLLTLAFPRLHLGIAIAIGAVLGTPFIVLGLRLYPQSTPANEASKQFWPTRTEARRVLWGFVAFVTLCACVFGPIAILISFSFFLPSGDNWGIVTVRLLFIVLAILGCYWWVEFASTTIPNWFRGRLSNETLDAITSDEPPEEPQTAKAAAIKNWQLAVIALVAFCVASGVIDFGSPWLNIDAGPKRTRGFVRLIQWCRGNPNTVTSSSVLVGTAASAWYVLRIRRAAVRTKANLPD
jgi:MFS family permease